MTTRPYGWISRQDEWNERYQEYEINVPEDEIQRLRRPWGSGTPIDWPFHLIIHGTRVGSDVSWNNFQGYINCGLFKDPKNPYEITNQCPLFRARILNFTSNCGAKQISHILLGGKYQKEYLKVIEWILYDRCNAGMLVGSDHVAGNTLAMIKSYGEGYQFSTEIANPTYGHSANGHNIKLFWKTQCTPSKPDILCT